ncbi:hypothetical protein CXF43_04730 [Corynebacterium bovis]|uniref:Uncharacterized protein n=1 Tax=Corynebacterium bovis TaxID=36808 RepID=A0A3R8QH23_9CORY|nr:hypothetical protein CXF38_05895 [Corynebacterium bovis]RRO80957.1 hypothetical protein CXF36_07810 [Corynebacterium bovis]RRO85987.1 hypothetical protein CXF48_08485 [Corynebacterium bovis]RRO88413.1 hypothetical protein CXF45_09260 [Corynebacterium bovis]RRO91552.1 hypothetical protein CXF40_06190 [Corynebacterium bovis]
MPTTRRDTAGHPTVGRRNGPPLRHPAADPGRRVTTRGNDRRDPSGATPADRPGRDPPDAGVDPDRRHGHR